MEVSRAGVNTCIRLSTFSKIVFSETMMYQCLFVCLFVCLLFNDASTLMGH